MDDFLLELPSGKHVPISVGYIDESGGVWPVMVRLYSNYKRRDGKQRSDGEAEHDG